MKRSYPVDYGRVEKKLDEALDLAKKIDQLLAEAASGGKHDTGNYADEFPDNLNLAFGEAYFAVSHSISKIKLIKFRLKNHVPDSK